MDVDFHLFSGLIVKIECPSILLLEVSFVLIKFIICLCVSVVCDMSMRVLLEMVSMYVGCRTLFLVGNRSVF